jgi:hypothetical protein
MRFGEGKMALVPTMLIERMVSSWPRQDFVSYLVPSPHLGGQDVLANMVRAIADARELPESMEGRGTSVLIEKARQRTDFEAIRDNKQEERSMGWFSNAKPEEENPNSCMVCRSRLSSSGGRMLVSVDNSLAVVPRDGYPNHDIPERGYRVRGLICDSSDCETKAFQTAT